MKLKYRIEIYMKESKRYNLKNFIINQKIYISGD